MEETLERTEQRLAAEENQVVTFYLGDEEFGFDIMSVQEIIRQPVLCRIPMAPAHVEGIANLRGMVLPVIDTRTRFGMAREKETDGTRVLVVDLDGQKTGLRVDRVRQVTRINKGEMEPPPAVIRGSVSSDFLQGVAKLDGGKRIIMSLNPQAICRMDMVVKEALASQNFAASSLGQLSAERGETGGADQSVAQLVSFTLGDEEFAFPMEQVREILRVESPNEVPNTPEYVLGIVTVRGNILPVIDLRVLVGLPTLIADVTGRATVQRERFARWVAATTGYVEKHAVASPGISDVEALRAWVTEFATSSEALMESLGALRVCCDKILRGLRAQTDAGGAAQRARDALPHAADALRHLGEFERRIEKSIAEDQRLVVVQAHGSLMALMVDRVREVLNVPKRLIDPPPRMAGAENQEMAGVAKLNDGKRLIMLLDADHLMRGDALLALTKQGGDKSGKHGGGVTMNDHRNGGSHDLAERQFVTFRLADGEYGIPIDQIQEIDRTSKMTRIPKSADFVSGITNLRGEVIPVINARKRFGLPLIADDEHTRVIIIDVGGKKTGLLVDSVREVLNQATRDIAPPPPSMAGAIDQEYISGIGKADGGKRMIVLLDVTKIVGT